MTVKQVGFYSGEKWLCLSYFSPAKTFKSKFRKEAIMPLDQRHGILSGMKLTVFKLRAKLPWYNRACDFLSNLENALHYLPEEELGSALNYWQEYLLPQGMR